MLDLQINHYASLKGFRLEWINELKKKAVDSALGLFPMFVSGEPLRRELRRTVDDHIAQRLKAAKEAAAADLAKPGTGDRKQLRDTYRAKIPGVKLLDICWAAQQHYREWKRWIAGELKDGSKPDLAFRQVLTSQKRPQELYKKPRPKKWE